MTNQMATSPHKFRPAGLERIIRFFGVGACNTVASMLLFVFYNSSLGLPYLSAHISVFITWVWFGYETQRRWVFGVQGSGATFAKYLLNQSFFTVLASPILWIIVEGIGLSPALAYFFTLGLIAIGIYLTSLVWIFRSPNQSARAL